MKWVEIIKVRTVGEPESLLVAEIFNDFSAMDKGRPPAEMKLYHHATVESDLCIHLYWESETISPRKSPVGLRIVESIGALGVANHSIWVEDVTGKTAPAV
ncbi:MAG: hypothetical protein JXR85_04525 [Deltaproteobacteria bacterium]|nr:hypothetical protein [Deltaproteobacteria bacterium]